MTPANRIAELEAQVATLNQVAQENFGSAVDWREQAEELEAKLARYESVTGLPDVIPDSPLLSYQLESGKHVVSFETQLNLGESNRRAQ